MSIAQQFGSACQMANEMPDRVAKFIEIDKTLKRRFREDSMTDVITASFLQLPGHQVTIDTPFEARTGSDFDLFIGNRFSFDLTHYRIQAKRLSDRSIWQNGLYMCIDHRVGKAKTLQADILCGAAGRGLIPLYAFYNHANVVASSGGVVQGISLADGYSIQKAIYKIVSGDKTYKRVGKLMDLFFPLSTILCSPTPGLILATPAQSRDAAQVAIESARARNPIEVSDDEMAEVARVTARLLEKQQTQSDAIGRREVSELLSSLREPTPEAERQDVLDAIRSEAAGPVIRHRVIPRPRVILIGDGEAAPSPSLHPLSGSLTSTPYEKPPQ